MSETKTQEHTPTPWTVRQTNHPFEPDCFVSATENIPGKPYAREIMSDEVYPEKQADAAHIVHCVNTHATLTRERDSLREALENTMGFIDNPAGQMFFGKNPMYREVIEHARQILSATEQKP